MAGGVFAIVLSSMLNHPVIATESSTTPAEWRFSLDVADAGVEEQWFDPSHGDGDWSRVSTHRWKGWHQQGLPQHEGFAWYRVTHQVDESLGKKHVYLYFAGVGDAAWVWVNGHEVGHHELVPGDDNPSWVRVFAFDVTAAVRAGEENLIAVRVQNLASSVAGIWQPVYFFAHDNPLVLNDMRDKANGLSRQVLNGLDPVVRFDVWSMDYAYDPILPDDPPPSRDPAIVKQLPNGSQARSLDPKVRLRGASGEYVPMAIRVHNASPQAITVRCDFLPVRHETLGLQLDMQRVEMHAVDYVLTKRRDLVPDPLPRLGPHNGLRIAPASTETFFVLFNTRGMPAGAWNGALHLTPHRAGPFLDIPFQLDVAPVTLPPRVPIWVTFWSNPPGSLWIPDRRGPNAAYLSLMRRAGANVVQSHLYPKPVLSNAGQIVGIDTVEFDRMLSRRGFGANDFLVVGHYSGTEGGYRKMFAGPDAPEASDTWKENFQHYLRLVAQHIHENHGVPYERWGLYLLDENAGPFHVTLGKLVRAADPKIQLWVNRLEDIETMKAAAPYIDILAPYAPWLSREGRGHGKNPESEKLMDAKGVPWWPYLHAWWQGAEKTAFPRARPHAAHNMMRMQPWLAWEQDYDGYGYWLFGMENYLRRYSGYPTIGLHLLNIPHENVGLIYLGHEGPITSRRLEAFREGWEDYKLLWTIEQAAALDGQDQAQVERARTHTSSAASQILDAEDDVALFLKWRETLLDDAAALCASAPLDASIADTSVTRDRIEITCAASRPVRVWTWVGRGRNEYGFVDATDASESPVVTIDGLVPGETCHLTLVFAGPEGQQRVISREVTAQGWN